MSTTTTASWPLSRFRTNVILRGSDEDACVGKRLAIGDVVVDVGMRIQRCVMVTRPQPGGIERDLTVLRTIHREREGRLAIGATVVREGVISVGDTIEEIDATKGTP